jgi:error-prone DNA polymerase
MLPRLRPREFYDLVIEVAIVRPGPIQGDMVHPYLRRRSGREPVAYPSEALRQVLGKTLGVPLFQEQAMKIAIVGAGFLPEEADRLRRAMATFKRSGDIHLFRDKFIAGMVRNGYDRDFAQRCFSQIEGFGTYGFPESHAASFALLVYVSAWIKCCYPEVFACALLNSQPMGFYAPAQIVRDARAHGVEVRPVDVNHSLWDCTLEPAPSHLENPLPPMGGEGRVRGAGEAQPFLALSPPASGRGENNWIGSPCWRVELLRCRGGVPALWEVEVADASGHVSVSAGLADRPAPPLQRNAEPRVRQFG